MSLVTHTNNSPVYMDETIDELQRTRYLCAELMKQPHYAKMGEVGIFAIVQKAKSVGMKPLEALNGGMYFVNGKVEMQGNAMLALIRQAGHSVTLDPKSTDNKVIMHGKRADNGDTWTVEYSVDDAKRAGIYKNTWEKFPKVMCAWRCVSMLGRFLFSDIIKGCYVEGEIKDAIPLDAPVQTIEQPKIIERTIEVIRVTDEQALELAESLAECPDDFQNRVKEYLDKCGYKSLDMLPLDLYELIKGRIETKMKEIAQQAAGQIVQQAVSQIEE